MAKSVVFSILLAIGGAACGGSVSSNPDAGLAAGNGGGANGGSGGSAGTGSSGTGGNGGARPDAAPDWYGCTASNQCELVEPGCCGACEPVMLNQVSAINATYDTDWQAINGCMGGTCGGCAPPMVGQTNRPNFAAVCQAGRCTAIDIRSDARTACDANSDCFLRFGTDCCERCGSDPTQVIALSKKVDLEAELCGGKAVACPRCVSGPLPDTVVAACMNGQCLTLSATPGQGL